MPSNSLAREEIEDREQDLLAPYAALAAQSRGRQFQQKPHPLRTDFQRDRDRIIHSTAFRRMEYKTQVFIPHEQDHFRTRLTHTIEVAQVSRTLARNLRLNEDLTEAIALVHDLGHTPFGHSGESILDRLLADQGGFNHNRQSLRVVELLEQRYPNHPGLNLTWEVREGIVKHETSNRSTSHQFDPGSNPTLEASLVDIADEIAYNAHDIDDGLSSGLLDFDQLRDEPFYQNLTKISPIDFSTLPADQKRFALARCLVDKMVTDVLTETQSRLQQLGIQTIDDVRQTPEKLCTYSAAMQQEVDLLKRFLNERLYRHHHLVTMTERAWRIIERLFAEFTSNPGLMSSRYQTMLTKEQPEIVIADYIAGMTDRYAEKVYSSLAGGTDTD